MSSENAKAVAQEVVERVRKGKKVNMQEIQLKHGYSKHSAKAMKAKRTKAFKEVIEPIVDQMERERQRAIKAMAGKIGKAKYRDLTDAVDKFTKNIQLLSGGDTERNTVTVTIKDANDYKL